MTLPARHQNRTGLLLYLYTNQVDDLSAATAELVRLHEDGWIQLQRTDTVDTDLAGADDLRRSELLEQSGRYVESFGALVLDHSRLDHAAIGSDEDAERLSTVCLALWGRRDHLGKQHLRDAMHVSTALKYGADGLITRDRRLRAKDPSVREAFNGFRLLTPEAALDIARRRKARAVFVQGEARPITSDGEPGSAAP